MTITYDQIETFIGTYLWTLFRITAFITAAPIFGSRTIPVRAKLGFALVLTMMIVPLIAPMEPVPLLSADAALITLHQIIIGAAMGLVFQLVFTMFIIGGQIIAYQMGLGFAQMIDPQSGTQVPVISQFYVIMVTLLFFALNGHIAFIRLLIESFQLLPIKIDSFSRGGIWHLIDWSSQMFIGGLSVALPAVAAILLINFTFAVVTRSAPQFNIFAIGFPITLVMGFFVILLTVNIILPHLTHQLEFAIEVVRNMLSEK
ncbi:MAG: flagellar biosynthetic protein FliR [Thiohalomonadales bacterium]